MVRLPVLVPGCIFWAIFGSSNVVGQLTFGRIGGTNQDKSGSTIPNASVSLTNLDENITREVISNPQGSYEFLNLLPGRYSVVGEKSGFTKVRIPELRLDSRQERRVDLTLEIAAVTATVEVQAQAAQLNTENATLSATT